MTYHRSLGSLTPDQLAHANQQVDTLASRLSRLNTIIRQAESAGLDARLVAELRAVHARLFAQLEHLTASAPSLSSSAFAEWVARATGVEQQVSELEQQTQAAIPGAEARRTSVIVASTIGALALAGGVAALIWYGTRR